MATYSVNSVFNYDLNNMMFDQYDALSVENLMAYLSTLRSIKTLQEPS